MAFTSTSAFTLLAHDDATGKLLLDAQRFQVGLAGAVLSDLSLCGRIELRDKRIAVVEGSARATGQPQLSPAQIDVLARLAAEPHPRAPRWWIQKLANRQLRAAVLADLVAAGLLRHTTVEVLGLFPSERFVLADPAAEAEVRRSVEAVLGQGVPADPASSTIIMLLSVTGLLRRQFGRQPGRLVKSIVAGEWAGAASGTILAAQDAQRAMHASLNESMNNSMQAAMQASMNAAIASSVAASVAATTATTP